MSITTARNFNFPTSIRFGAGVIKELGPHLKSLGKMRPFFVTDHGLASLPLFQEVLKMMKENGLGPIVFSDIDKNPIEKNVLDGANSYREQKGDCIIGFGGGASMDVARAIALKAHHARPLFDFDDALGGDQFVTEEIPYFVTVPTTSGTGSEVGRSSVISENDSHKKRILFSPRLMASKVFADPELTMKLPAAITAATGMDAFVHNLEAYLSKGFSPLCDGIAVEGIRLIADSLEAAVDKPTIENRSKMMMAAIMGATAFQKGLGVVHSLAHSLSTHYDTHHGLANAVMLTHGMRFNQSVCQEKINYLSSILKLEQKDDSLINWISQLNKNIGLPNRLTSIGVTKDGIDKLSQTAFEDLCHQSNPRTVSLEQFKTIYSEALS